MYMSLICLCVLPLLIGSIHHCYVMIVLLVPNHNCRLGLKYIQESLEWKRGFFRYIKVDPRTVTFQDGNAGLWVGTHSPPCTYSTMLIATHMGQNCRLIPAVNRTTHDRVRFMICEPMSPP